MDFALNDEQQMLQDSARRFFAERHPLTRARQALRWSDDSQQALWRDMADMGWLALLVPEENNGLGLGLCEAFLVAEAAGRQLVNLPLASSAVLLPLLMRESNTPGARLTQWVADLSTGQSAFHCTLDDSARLDHADQSSHALWIRGLHDDQQPVCIALDPRAATVEAAPLDVTVRQARIDRSSAAPSSGAAPEWETLDIDAGGRALARAGYRQALGAQLLGAAAAALDLACAYAREREQFGKSIGSYQAIKHQLADAWMGLDNARLSALYAAAALDGRLSDWRFACAAAEFTAIEAAQQMVHVCVQVHGGIGFTWEHDAHLYLKRVQRLSAQLGGASQALAQVEAIALL